jgi:hypothetical protein
MSGEGTRLGQAWYVFGAEPAVRHAGEFAWDRRDGFERFQKVEISACRAGLTVGVSSPVFTV